MIFPTLHIGLYCSVPVKRISVHHGTTEKTLVWREKSAGLNVTLTPLAQGHQIMKDHELHNGHGPDY